MAALAGGSSVTAPQFFEVDAVYHFTAFTFYPYSGPTRWEHLRRIDSLTAGGGDHARYVVIGAPLPEQFWLGFDRGTGYVGVNRRAYGDPGRYPGIETVDTLPVGLRSTGRFAVPGVPGTVAGAITLPAAAAAGSS